jgi:hypothetical protein
VRGGNNAGDSVRVRDFCHFDGLSEIGGTVVDIG